MDPIAEIKSRLPIEELVRSYTQLTKKGRNLMGLCPFHHDTHPSFLVSPDKGICYCFPCQKGGDIFSFYQLIEGVDFPTALKDLAERTGVELPKERQSNVTKDEKERMRMCLDHALTFFASQLKADEKVQAYLSQRGVSPKEVKEWQIGYAPTGGSHLYEVLLKAGFSRSEISAAGLCIERELGGGSMLDRFRGRLMFPIHDAQGRTIGFGGRTMVGDDAKYLNSPETSLYRKSSVLFGMDRASAVIREQKRCVLVEGYFDVLACVRAGVINTVATCGTALTEEHVRLLKRSAEILVLSLDQDRAGKAAADRAWIAATSEGMQVEGVVLPSKDPADMALQSLEELSTLLTASRPYLEVVLDEYKTIDLRNPSEQRAFFERLLPLLAAFPSKTGRDYALALVARHLPFTTPMSLAEDLERYQKSTTRNTESVTVLAPQSRYSPAEIVLGLLFLYPRQHAFVRTLIEPEDPFTERIHRLILDDPSILEQPIDALPLEPTDRERLSILLLYLEQHQMGEWSEAVAEREIKTNCRTANREVIRRKQAAIVTKLLQARKENNDAEVQFLENEYQQILKLAKIAE